MRATNKEIKRILSYLWKDGTGSHGRMAESCNLSRPELSRFLRGGTITDEKYNKIMNIVNGNKPD